MGETKDGGKGDWGKGEIQKDQRGLDGFVRKYERTRRSVRDCRRLREDERV